MIISSHSEKYKTVSECAKVLAEGEHSLDDEKAYRSDVDLSQRYRNSVSPEFRSAEYCVARIKASEAVCERRTNRKVRRDAVRLFSTVTSFPKSWPDDAVKELAKELYDAHTRILEEVGMAVGLRCGYVIHFDEKSPHMHEYDIPMTSAGKLSCKSILSKKTLRAFHKAEYEVYKAFEERHPELEKMESYTHGSARQHLGTQAFKKQKLEQEIGNLSRQKADIQKKKADLDRRLAESENKRAESERALKAINIQAEPLRALEAEISRSKASYDEIASHADEDAEAVRSAFAESKEVTLGKHRGLLQIFVPKDAYKRLRSLAEKAETFTKAYDAVSGLASKVEAVLDKAKSYYREARAERERAEKIMSGEAYRDALSELQKAVIDRNKAVAEEHQLSGKYDRLWNDFLSLSDRVDSLERQRDSLADELEGVKNRKYEHLYAQEYSDDFAEFVADKKRRERSRDDDFWER